MKETVEIPQQDVVVSSEAPAEPYTVFSPWKKRYIIFLAAFAGMFSPMSSFVFYPAITTISESLDVSIGLVNLAISTVLILMICPKESKTDKPVTYSYVYDRVRHRPIFDWECGRHTRQKADLHPRSHNLSRGQHWACNSKKLSRLARIEDAPKCWEFWDHLSGLWDHLRYHDAHRKRLSREHHAIGV